MPVKIKQALRGVARRSVLHDRDISIAGITEVFTMANDGAISNFSCNRFKSGLPHNNNSAGVAKHRNEARRH